jgi:hypothetical protein
MRHNSLEACRYSDKIQSRRQQIYVTHINMTIIPIKCTPSKALSSVQVLRSHLVVVISIYSELYEYIFREETDAMCHNATLTLHCLFLSPLRHEYTGCGISQLTAAHFVGDHILGN